MNGVSEKLLEAISIIANKTTDSLSFDKTIQANIVSEDDAENFIYSIKYQDNIMQAFGSTSYSIGDWVYVKIPEGDFSNKKIIERKVNTVANKIVVITEKPDSASGKLFHIELNQGLVAGKDYDSISSPSWEDIQSELKNKEKPKDSAVDIKIEQAKNQIGNFSVPLDIFPQNDFSTFAKSFSKLMVSCNFQTIFNNIPETGEFGIKLEIETTNREGNITTQNLVFNNYDMTGNYYNYNTPVNEYKVFDLGINCVKAELKSIELYQEDFVYDTEYYYNADLEESYNPIQNYKPNIIFSDLKLDFLGEGEGSYRLTTNPTGKNNIIKDDTIFPPTAELYFGPSIVSEAKENIQWFEYDPKSMVSSAVGAGWQPWSPLEESAEGAAANEWYTKELMAYCEYDGMTFHSEPIGYRKETLGFSITYSPENEGTLTVNNDANLVSELAYSWYNNNKEVGETESINQVNRGETLTYTCYVYKKITIEEEDNLILLQTLTYTIDAAYLANRYASAINFKYSHSSAQYSIGSELIGPDTAYKNSQIDRTIEVISTDKDIQIQKKEWLDRDGNVIIGTKENPLNYTGSMITKIWIEEDILHYNIRSTYSSYAASETKNYVQARVTYTADKEYETTKNAYVEFVRIGDNGTNGSIFHCDIDLEESKLKGSAFIGNETITEEATFDWTGSRGINIDVDNDIALALEENNYLSYARLEAAAAGYPSAYAFYPIYHDGTNIVNIITNLPKTILYNTNGYDPAYISEDLWFKYNGIDEIAIETLEVFDGDGIIRITDESRRFIPNEKRASEYCILLLNNTYYLPILFLLNRYGNEAINGWDGSKLEIDENGQHIFTPTLGAGTKNDNNQFSGVVMGKDIQQNKTGIYGYKDGKNTFGLMEDGSAYFGSGTQLNSENRTITIGSLGTTTKTLKKDPAEKISVDGSYGKYIGIKLKSGNNNILSNYIGQALTISFEIQATEYDIGKDEESSLRIYPYQAAGISIADTFNFTATLNDWELKTFTTTVKAWSAKNTEQGAEMGNEIGIFSAAYNISTEEDKTKIKQYPFKIRNVKLILGLESNPEDGDYVNVNFQYGTGDPGDSESTTSFKVSRDGLLSAKNAVIEGTVYAGEGHIGGMSLSNDKLFNISATTASNATGISTWLSNGINTRFNYVSGNEIFLWAGAVNASKKSDGTWDISQLGIKASHKESYADDIKNSNWTSSGSNMFKKITDTASFYVTHEGKLYAKNVNIDGKITANSEGQIANWYIKPNLLMDTDGGSNGNYHYICTNPSAAGRSHFLWFPGLNDDKTSYTDYFCVNPDGSMEATNATITGEITANSGQFYNDVLIGTETENSLIIQSYAGGDGTQLALNEDNEAYFAVYKNPDTSKGEIDLGYGGNSYTSINERAIHSIGLYASSVFIPDGSGLYLFSKGSTLNDLGGSSGMDSADKNGFKLIDLTVPEKSEYYTAVYSVNGTGAHSGYWSYGTASDQRLKNSITLLDSRYEEFFDNLQPYSFKYNNYDIDKIHCGFIAQEVFEHLDKAGFDPIEIAALDIQHTEHEKDYWLLNYNEFIALNTWQIQKAKARISELETRVSQLESLLQANLD